MVPYTQSDILIDLMWLVDRERGRGPGIKERKGKEKLEQSFTYLRFIHF